MVNYSISINNWLVISAFIIGLGTILYGVFNLSWYINEISAIFLIVTIASGIIAGMEGNRISETVLKSVAYVAPGAFMVGFASTISVLMEMGHISDSISFYLSEALKSLPLYLSVLECLFLKVLLTFLFLLEVGKH